MRACSHSEYDEVAEGATSGRGGGGGGGGVDSRLFDGGA